MPLELAVVWVEGDGVVHSGSLELGDDRVALDGADTTGGIVAVRIPYDDLVSVRIGRSNGDRLNGLYSLILERRSAPQLKLAAIGGGGAIFDVSDLLAELIAERKAPATRVALVLPLRRGKVERARELVAGGPPFALERAAIDRHDVFVGEREVVFVFEGADVQSAAERLLRDPAVWKAAAAWRECIGGAPRLVEPEFSWSRALAAGAGPS